MSAQRRSEAVDPAKGAQSPVAFSYGRLFVLGLGFLVITLSWSVYNAYVPLFLGEALADRPYRTALVGAIMTFDNVAAVTLQPWVGALSDRTWTRIGRRMPYLAAGIPVAALSFTLIPLVRAHLAWMLAGLVVMNVAMATFRAPAVALMPDITPSPLRSKANGIINFMGGLGALVALFGFSSLYRVDPALPFAATSVLMLAVLAILLRAIREPRPAEGPAAATTDDGEAGGALQASGRAGVGIWRALVEVWRDPDRSTRYLLLAIFCWFIGWSGVEALFTLYGVEVWGMQPADASFVLGFFPLAFLVFSIPAGIIATAAGRRRTILAGLAGLVAMLLVMAGVGPGMGLRVALLGAGLFWALVNINSYPMVVDATTASRTGAYTGLYYLFSTLAAIVAPPVFGWLMDVLGRGVMFPAAAVAMAVASGLMLRVRRGEAPRTAAAAAPDQAAAS